MPAPDITSASVTNVNSAPGSSDINVNVSIHRRIYRQATKRNRAHQIRVEVTYDSVAATSETVSATVLISATTLVGQLPDRRREVRVKVPRGNLPEPAGAPNFQSSCTLILVAKPGNERDDDGGDDDAISEATYDNS